MKKKIINSTLVEEYLQSVNSMQEAQTDDFFYTRLKARMEKQAGWEFPLKPAWIVTTLALLLLLNSFMAASRFENDNSGKAVATTGLQSFATAYDLSVQSIY